MSTTVENRDDVTNSVSNFLGSLHQKVGDSKNLHDLGVNDQLATYVHDFFSDPLTGLMESNSASLNALKKMVRNLVNHFLTSQKEDILKAFSTDVDAQLMYYICLKNDTFDSRDKYFDFLEFYEELGLKNRLPLYIKFVPHNVVDLVKLEEISFK